MTKEELILLINNFLEQQELEELAYRTIKSYKNALFKFANFLPSEIILTKKTIISYKEYLVAEGYALKSRNQFIVVINKFLKFINRDDCRVKKFKEQAKSNLEEYIEPQEHKRMLRWAKRLDMMPAYFVIRIFAETGARISEISYFTVENLESNYIKGAYNKGKERTLIMTNELRKDLKKYCKDSGISNGVIFHSLDPKFKNDPNKIVNSSTIWRWIKKISKYAKIKPSKMHPHAWRHLFAKQCKEHGIDLDELADILGHTNLNTTAIYTKTSMKEKRLKLENLWKKNKE